MSAVKRAPGALGGDLERAGLADDTVGLVDRQRRRRAAAGDDVRARGGEREDEEEREEPAEHGLNNTSLIKLGFAPASGGIV